MSPGSDIRHSHTRRPAISVVAIFWLSVAMIGVVGCDGSEPASDLIVPATGTNALDPHPRAPSNLAPTTTVAAIWPALTFEGWVDQVDLVVVGTIIDVTEPATSAADAELAEDHQWMTIDVNQILKKRSGPQVADITVGSMVELVHSITYEGMVFPRDMVGRRTLASVGIREPLFGGEEEDDILSVGLMSSYVEVDGVAILFHAALASIGYADEIEVTAGNREIVDSGRETLAVSTIARLIERALNTQAPLQAQLGYQELFGERVADQGALESP